MSVRVNEVLSGLVSARGVPVFGAPTRPVVRLAGATELGHRLRDPRRVDRPWQALAE
jgi:hypothetical protein